MEKYDVTNLRLLKYGAIPFALFWILSLAATFNLFELNTLMLIIEFILLSFSLLGLARWQKGNKLTLTKTELIIRDWAEGIYYLGSSSMLNENAYILKNIKKIIISNPPDLLELAKTTKNEALRKQLTFPRDTDTSKLSSLTLMYVQIKDGSIHVSNIQPFRVKSITSLLTKLQKQNIEIIDKRGQ